MAAPISTFNLTALGDRLFAERRLLPLAGKIRRAGDLHSLSTDLALALESIGALDVFLEDPTAHGDNTKLAIQSALLNNALVLYARATNTTSKQRKGFDLRSRFSEQSMAAHNELLDLRNHAIAHFGSGGSYSGEWQAELVILQQEGDVGKVGFVARRQMVDRKLIPRVRTQIELALALLRELGKEQIREVADEIDKIVADDSDFHKEITQHPLNLDLLLTSADAGNAARSSVGQGRASGIVTHR